MGTLKKVVVTVKFPEKIAKDIDELIEIGIYQTRSEFIRRAVREQLKKDRWYQNRYRSFLEFIEEER